MFLKEIRLRSFRNYRRLDWGAGPGVHILTGENGQGKTNLLEAVYLLSTMKSFRGARHQEMIHHGHKGYFVGAEVQSDVLARIKFYWGVAERKLSLNEEPIGSLREYLGVVRTVIFSNEDIHLVRGSGRYRRRFLDLICCQTQPGYLETLQQYSRALKHRNALLKKRSHDRPLLDSFSGQLVRLGNQLIKSRHLVLPEMARVAQSSFDQISHGKAEELAMKYKPSIKEDFESELKRNLERELATGVTSIGPHRDDIQFKIKEMNAASHASEGQQRSLVLALKLAQVHILKNTSGVNPILLIDDVLGELDPARKSAFMPMIEKAQGGHGQVMMTTTDPHLREKVSRLWNFWEVKNGSISKLNR